jgi:hypothetical protein
MEFLVDIFAGDELEIRLDQRNYLLEKIATQYGVAPVKIELFEGIIQGDGSSCTLMESYLIPNTITTQESIMTLVANGPWSSLIATYS